MVNDELVGINGKSASDLSLVDIEDMLKVADTSVELEIKGEAGVKKVTLELKKLL